MTTPTTESITNESELPRPIPDAKPSVKVLKKKDEGTTELEDGEKEEKGSPMFSKEMLALKNADHLAIKEWLTQLSGQASIRVEVKRQEPKFFRDPKSGEEKKVSGHLHTYDRIIDEDELHDRHGGGTFQLVVKVRSSRGNWQYFNARTIELAGDPKLDDVPRAFVPPQQTPAQPTHDPLTANLMGKAFDFMADAARGPRNAPAGASATEIAAAVNAATAPMHVMLETMKAALESRDREISSLREQMGKGDPYKDKLLDKMLDTDNARIQAIRLQHESEIRVLKEQAIANENRIRDQHQRDLDRVERMHDRAMTDLRASFDTQKSALETSSSTQKLVLDSEQRRLEKENTELKAEVVALRNKKDPSLKEKMNELKELKDLVGGDDDDEDEKSTIEKVIEATGNLPIVASLAERFAGGTPAQQPAQQQQQQQVQAQPQRPRKLLRDRRSGAVLAPTPDGQLVPVQRVVPQADGNASPQVPPVDPAVVKQALDYMTNAFQAGTSPEDFADTARPMIPKNVLGAIRALGIDEFLSKVAQLDGTSPLATQSGRNWRRRVAARLLGEEG